MFLINVNKSLRTVEETQTNLYSHVTVLLITYAMTISNS
jgi:hypothetical protein